MAPCDKGASSPPAVAVIFLLLLLLFGFFLDISLDDLLDITNLDQDIFRFQISMNNATFPMHVIQTQEDLFCDLFDQRHGNAAVVPALNQTQQVLTQYLEDHADVSPIGTLVFEGVEQTDDMFPTRMVRVGFDDAAEKLNFIDGGFGIMSGGADDFKGDVLAGDVIARQPDGGKMTPAQLADDHVATIVVGFPDTDGMVTTFDIILGILLFGGSLDFFFFG